MRTIHFIYTFFLLTLQPNVLLYAQSKPLIVASPPTSMWSYYRLADSFSKQKDSIKASEHFLKINPFLFISEENATPNTIDTIFSSFALTAQARKQYKKIFDSVYSKPRTKTYKLFAKMLNADQEVRHRLDSIQNETSEKLPPDFLNKVDSLHFEYLYQYVKNKGWPTVENGSLPASIIALHDHQRHGYYLPIVRKAVLDGIFEESTYELMKSYFSGKKTQQWENIVATSNHVKIDISTTINFKIPDTATLNKIATAIKQHCPIKKVFWVYESPDSNSINIWWNEHTKKFNNNYDDSIFHNTLHELFLLNCNCDSDIQVCQKIISSGNPKRMVLYLVY
jgi:hypothetical protein